MGTSQVSVDGVIQGAENEVSNGFAESWDNQMNSGGPSEQIVRSNVENAREMPPLRYDISRLATSLQRVFKTSNRIVEDIRYDLRFMLGDDKMSILNSRTVDYSKKLASLDKPPYTILVLNDTDYAPIYEKVDSYLSSEQVHIVRCLLVDSSVTKDKISDTKVYHLNVKVKKKVKAPTGPSSKQHFFLIQKNELFEADRKDLYSYQEKDYFGEAQEAQQKVLRETTFHEGDDIDTKVRAVCQAGPTVIDCATYICFDTQTLVHVEITEPEFVKEDLARFEQTALDDLNKQKLNKSNKDKLDEDNSNEDKDRLNNDKVQEKYHSVTQSEALKTLFKLLKGPLLYTNTTTKAIELTHKVINLHVEADFLLKKLFFSASQNDGIVPINYLHYADPYLQNAVREWMLRMMFEVIYHGVTVNSRKPAAGADRNYAKNSHFREFKWSPYIPIFYRILNEIDIVASINYESNYKDLSFKLPSVQLSFKNDDFINLSIFSFYGANLIIDNYILLKQIDPANIPLYFQSLKNVALLQSSNYAQNNDLNLFVAQELSTGTLAIDDVKNAFRFLGISDEQSAKGTALVKHFNCVDDETIVEAYRFQLVANPSSRSELKLSLRTLAAFKKSRYITEFLDAELLPLAESYLNLGVTEKVDDDTIVIAYDVKCNDEPSVSSDLSDKSFVSIATYRRSHFLLNYCEQHFWRYFKHLLPKNSGQNLTATDCYSFLKVDPHASDFQILTIVQQIFHNEDNIIRNSLNQYPIDHPHFSATLDNFKRLRLYLRRLNAYRNSDMIAYFLEKGAIHPNAVPLDHWPTGLNNIGNTCYLNSLLQFYFVIKPLRDLVLDFQKTFPLTFNKQITDNLTFSERRIGGRIVKDKEVERSYQFTYNLRDLFHAMIYARSRDIIPSKELAYLAFSPVTQEVEFAGETNEEEVDTKEVTDSKEITDNKGITDTSEMADTKDSNDTKEITGTKEIDGTNMEASDIKEASDTIQESDYVNKNSPVLIDSPSEPDTTPGSKRKYASSENLIALDDNSEEHVADKTDNNNASDAADNDAIKVENDHTVSSAANPANKPLHRSTAKISFDQLVNTLEIGRQQDVTECIENVLFQLEAALDPLRLENDGEQYDIIKQLFYGKTKQTLEPINKPSKVRTKTERFSSLLVNIGDHPRNMYNALDGYFTEDIIHLSEDGDVRRYLTVTEIPDILQVHIQRVQYDLQRGIAFKSTQPLPFSEKLYMDRYMETDDEQLLTKKQQSTEWKKEVVALKDRYKLITTRNANGLTVKDSLISTKAFLESDVMKQHGLSVKQETIDTLQEQIDKITEDIENLSTQIAQLHTKIDSQFESYKKVGYDLFAIFIHRGEASYGHYWIYIRDPKRNVYRKYNDETVTEVSLEEIFNFKEDNTATPYFVVYAKESMFKDGIEPLKRIIDAEESTLVNLD